MSIDLQPFCGREITRYYIIKPWSLGEWTYATNGHICIRVPRRADVPEMVDNPANTVKIFVEHFTAPAFRLFRGADLPEVSADDLKCERCDGRGHMHDCPDCTCECEWCDSSGTNPHRENRSVGINGVPFAACYVRLIQVLPNLRVSTAIKPSDPMPFTFEGGDGVLMPRRVPCNEHVEERP